MRTVASKQSPKNSGATPNIGTHDTPSSNETFSEQAVEKLFSIQAGRFAWARVGFGTDLIVMQAAKVIPPQLDDRVATEMFYGGDRTKFQSDLTAQLVRALQNSYGVTINQQNIETSLGELVAQ